MAADGGAHAGDERAEVRRQVEAVGERLEELPVARRIEVADEGRRGVAHGAEHAEELGTEEVGAAVGEAGGEEARDLLVGGISVPARRLHRIEADARGAIERVEERIEDGLEAPRSGGGQHG